MTTVLTQGTFDILHPGHVHYLQEGADRGDELHVIVARRENVGHKEKPILSNAQRRKMVGKLDPVDVAHLGHESDFFVPVEEIKPDLILLGCDQHHDAEALEVRLTDRGLACSVERATPRSQATSDEILSSSEIVNRILEVRQNHLATQMRPPTRRIR